MRNSMITILGLGLAAALASTSAPASAAEDARCSALPQQVRSALPNASPDAAKAATRRLRTGELLCRANNARGAAREFQVALKLLRASDTQVAAAGAR